MAKDEQNSAGQNSAGLLSRFLAPARGSGFTTLVITAMVIFAAFALAALWQKYSPAIVAGHVISEDTIEITPAPPWIRSNIKHEVVVASSLAGHSIREEDLTLRVAEAFRLHSWVATVKRVSKRHPANVVVTLEYREPVAMVEVTDRTINGQFLEGGLYPIDSDGVLLPTADFAAQAVDGFPRVAARDAAPMSPAGVLWGDERIHGAAATAKALLPYWQKLDLYRILAVTGTTDARGQRDVVYRLLTRQQTMILWGHAPGKESPAEATAEIKIARLLKLKRENGSLNSVAPEKAIDVRDANELELAALPEDTFEQ